MTAPAELKTWLTFDECADRCARAYWLEKLADQVAYTPETLCEYALLEQLTMYAHHTLSAEERSSLFDDHVAALRRLAQLDTSAITWADVNENLTCCDRTAAAREILDAAAEDAFDVLLNGKKGGTR
ncbi:MAG TPA: hypothetical protein VLW50_34320 [Streptosporangiaceae bacterium]|nr:hypothetical protein [Streptosporangiaceae bacterium]